MCWRRPTAMTRRSRRPARSAEEPQYRARPIIAAMQRARWGTSMRASGYYLKSVAMAPRYAQVREYLGEAYVEKGDLVRAKEQLRVIKSICGTHCRGIRRPPPRPSASARPADPATSVLAAAAIRERWSPGAQERTWRSWPPRCSRFRVDRVANPRSRRAPPGRLAGRLQLRRFGMLHLDLERHHWVVGAVHQQEWRLRPRSRRRAIPAPIIRPEWPRNAGELPLAAQPRQKADISSRLGKTRPAQFFGLGQYRAAATAHR